MEILTDICIVLALALFICAFFFVLSVSIRYALDTKKREDLYGRLAKYLNESGKTESELEHLTVEGIMDVLAKEGYKPERADETTVDFKKEGINYRISYSRNRMDLTLSFTMDKPDAEEESRVRDICAQVSDTIIMADVFLDGPDKDGEYTILFKISLILRTKAEFAASFSEYLGIISELHSRFYKEYDKGEDSDGQADDETSDPAAITIGVSSKRIPS